MPLGNVILDARINSDKRWVVLTVTANEATHFTVYRVTGDTTQAVRGALNKASDGALVVADYEAPQNTSLSYYAEATDGTQTRVSSIVKPTGKIDRGGDVVFGLTNPLAWLQLNVEGLPELVRKGRRDVVEVIGRPDPIAVSDVRLYPSGTLTLITLTDGERQALNNLLADGGVLAFSPRYPDFGFSDVWYFSVGDARESRTSPLGQESSRRHALDVQRIAPPPADFVGPAFRTWQNLKDASVTWADLLRGQTTWLRLQVSD
jgi:hypothetical protein